LHRARSEAVHRVWFVFSARHQAREGELHALRAIAPEDEAVERIEGEEVLIEGPSRSDMGEHAAFRSVWIDVIKMLEIRRIFEITEGRYSVALGVLSCLHILGEGRCERTRTEEERFAACQLQRVDHWCFPILPVSAARD
jgi:hypothetical protein